MPAKVAKKNGKFRVVEPSGRLVRSKKGAKPVDGGGFSSRISAQKQVNAINRGLKT